MLVLSSAMASKHGTSNFLNMAFFLLVILNSVTRVKIHVVPVSGHMRAIQLHPHDSCIVPFSPSFASFQIVIICFLLPLKYETYCKSLLDGNLIRCSCSVRAPTPACRQRCGYPTRNKG